jgi:DNA-binding XRE family transcriptional regulator
MILGCYYSITIAYLSYRRTNAGEWIGHNAGLWKVDLFSTQPRPPGICILTHLIYTSVLKETIMSNPKVLAEVAPAPRKARAGASMAKRVQPQTFPRNATVSDGVQVYRLDPQARIAVIRQGISAATISSLSARMGMSKEHLLSSLGLSRATISRKEKDATLLSSDESERVLGVEALIGMVQTMVEQSGDPAGFNAARWDTFEGQKLVAELLSMSQSGAYA